MNIKLFFVFLFFSAFAYGQNHNIQGRVLSENLAPLEDVDVSTADGKFSVVTDASGFFRISFPYTYDALAVNRLGYAGRLIALDSLGGYGAVEIVLKADSEIQTVTVHGEKLNAAGSIKIDPKISTVIPSMNESLENILRTQPGVIGARNELSSQYSVRGGNYDENLVYVNGIEIYRPKLIRSGQQEGLSFVNPLMVSSVKFSAGGFESKYGDKMSSVLDVRYKKPSEFKAALSGSFLGASGFVQGTAFNKKLSHISSLRYKTNRFVLNTLDTEGDYKPTFIDFQSFLDYRINRDWNLNFLLNVSDNQYLFVPESRRTSFGTISRAFGIFVNFDGRENDRFTTATGALNLDWHPSNDISTSLAVSYTQADEYETYDIVGRYSLNELESDMTSDNVGDSILNLGIGKFIRHARNNLQTRIISLVHKGTYKFNDHYVSWGADWRTKQIYDQTEQWELLDSAGYSIPYNSDRILLNQSYHYQNDFLDHTVSAFVQDRFHFDWALSEFELITGMRLTYSFYSEELLFSPRMSAAYRPGYASRHTIRFSAGYYYQPPFYKSLKTFEGKLVENSSSQKSIHFLVADEFRFTALGRDLVLNAEMYYKVLRNQIPFEVDNVRIRYYADQRSNGYAAGMDFKISGEFVPGVDSWFSLSLLKTEENIINTGQGEDDGFGYIPRPTDQRVNAALFLQDYLPMNENFKVHLNLVYGTAFPFGPPEEGRAADTLRSPDYKRVDLGGSVVLLRGERLSNVSFLKNIESVWFTAEVFNLLHVRNTVSYNWLRVVPNSAAPLSDTYGQYATPNKLTSRMLNLKIQLRF
jgi:hypothetical protein